MRYQGKIANWKDDQGFGFVIPNGRKEKAFVHVKAFASRSRRPAEGDLITYELIMDEKGRFRADEIRFAGERAVSAASSGTRWFGFVFIALFFCFLLAAALTAWIPLAVPVLYLAASVIAFLAYAFDKDAAQNKRWRTKESTLHLLGLAGGWPGAFLAQKIMRHKSKKEEFQAVFWITIILNCCALGWILTKPGAGFLRSAIALAA
ncbi:'Cold-shock' DNA-binding domain protein [Collimonas fungivorans]|uniref:'Cold-shock' DNA-binding domain protein n=1 Tax=Collimonas fungivorans TaxID=158899 RepID=A0A127P9R6_9BURK|nr:cold shock and DUF1294 domain-containing protein [Collimonas fungivorans]AMO94562.1 'Cold-shock' DNA-binding domain protein [Collimonas fungivorans]